MKKKVLLMLCLIMAFASCLISPQAENDENPFYLDSSSAVIMDANTKRVLYSYNGNDKHYPASITKVMTMLLGVESGDLSKEITISEYGAMSVEVGSSHISIMPGETMTMKDAIMAACLVSANDGANMIAEGVAGDIDSFVALMNQRAKEIGCTNTNFANPHGLHDEDHYTTAIDMAKIMSEACSNETYLSLTGQDEYVIEPTNKTTTTRYLYGQNKCMYEESEYYIEEVMSAKSGYTDQAMHTYVAYAKKGNVELVVCLMDCDSGSGMYTDLQTLFKYGFETYSAYDGLEKKLDLPSLDHSLFTTGGTLKLSGSFEAPAIENDSDKNNFKFVYNVDEEKAKEASVGDVVGTVQLTYNDEVIDTRNLILETPLKNVVTSFFKGVLNIIKIIVIIILLGIALLFAAKKIYTKYKNNQIRKKRQNRRKS